MKKIIVLFLISSLAIAGLGLLPSIHIIHPHIWLMLIYFLIIAIIAHLISNLGFKYKSGMEHMFYMASMMFRLLLSLLVLVLYAVLYKQPKAEVIIAVGNFLFLYLLFTVIEIKSFLHNLRQNSRNTTEL